MPTDNPWLKRLRDLRDLTGFAGFGEEQLGRLTAQLLSNDRFVAAVQGLITRSLSARESLERSVRAALSAMRLPTAEELEALRAKVEGLETLVSSVEKKLEALLRSQKRSG